MKVPNTGGRGLVVITIFAMLIAIWPAMGLALFWSMVSDPPISTILAFVGGVFVGGLVENVLLYRFWEF